MLTDFDLMEYISSMLHNNRLSFNKSSYEYKKKEVLFFSSLDTSLDIRYEYTFKGNKLFITKLL